MTQPEVRPKIHVFRIICIILPTFVQSLGLVVFYGLFTSMFMMLGMTDRPWFTPLTWFISPVFGLSVPFYGAWNDSIFWRFRRRSMILLSHLILTVAFVLFELCHLQKFSSLGGNVASGLVGFCLFFISQCPGPTAYRSLLFDVLGTGQEILGNTIITVVGTFGSLTGGIFVAYVPQPFLYSMIFIVLCSIPPLFAGREEWYLEKHKIAHSASTEHLNERVGPEAAVPTAVAPAAPTGAERALVGRHPIKKIFLCILCFLKAGPLRRAALCMFVYGIASYGMMTIATDFTAKIIYHGNPVPGPPDPNSPYGSFADYMAGIQMSAFISMIASVIGVVLSFTIFPLLKIFGLRLSVSVSNLIAALLNLFYIIPSFNTFNKSWIWIRWLGLPFGAIQGSVSMSVPYIVVNESIMGDHGLFIGVVTCFYIIGCFVPTLSNLILSSVLPEFSGERHQYQWYCVSYLIYGLIMAFVGLFIQHGELYEAMMAMLAKKAEAGGQEDATEKKDQPDLCEKEGKENGSVNAVNNSGSPSLTPTSPAIDDKVNKHDVESELEVEIEEEKGKYYYSSV